MKNSDFNLVSILPYFHVAVRCGAIFYSGIIIVASVEFGYVAPSSPETGTERC